MLANVRQPGQPVSRGQKVFISLLMLVFGLGMGLLSKLLDLTASNAAIWLGITLLSPALAYVCWYAKGRGPVAIALSGIILGVIMAQAILLQQELRIVSVGDALVWVVALFMLRKPVGEFAVVLVLMVAVALLCQTFFPYFG